MVQVTLVDSIADLTADSGILVQHSLAAAVSDSEKGFQLRPPDKQVVVPLKVQIFYGVRDPVSGAVAEKSRVVWYSDYATSISIGGVQAVPRAWAVLTAWRDTGDGAPLHLCLLHC